MTLPLKTFLDYVDTHSDDFVKRLGAAVAIQRSVQYIAVLLSVLAPTTTLIMDTIQCEWRPKPSSKGYRDGGLAGTAAQGLWGGDKEGRFEHQQRTRPKASANHPRKDR